MPLMHMTCFRLPVVLFALVLFMLGGSVQMAQAQTGTVRGIVTDAETGEALQGVNVALLGASDELVTGTVSGSGGVYALSRLKAGAYVLRASFVGFETWEQGITLEDGERILLNIQLQEGAEALDELVVEEERDSGSVRVTAGQVTIIPADIEMIPSPDVSGDLVNYLTTLPGIVSVGDRGGQLFVRGGEPWQNLVLLDGLWIYQPFHVLGFFSSFPADIIADVDVFAGGFPSQYGGRISSVMDVTSRNGSKYGFKGSASLAPFVSGLLVEGPLHNNGKVSFLASVRESVIGQGASRIIDQELPYEFGDLYIKLHALPSYNSQFTVNFLRTHDKGSVFEGSSEQPREFVEWTNEAGGLRYLVFPRAFSVMAEFAVNASRLESWQSRGTPAERFSRLQSVNTIANLTHFHGNTTIRWGLFARSLTIESELNGLFQNLSFREEFVTEIGMYVEPEWSFGDGWELRAGARIHGFPSKNVGFLEPRLRLVRRGDHDEWSFAAGSYHQEIVGLVDRRDAAGVFSAWTSSPNNFDVPSALHAIAGYRRALSASFEVGLEGYAKKLDNLFIPEWTAFPRFTTRIQNADGRVFGGDLRVQYAEGGLHVLATYGLSSVEYSARQESLPLWYGTDRVEFRPAHDRRHQLNMVVNMETAVAVFSARWQFGSGLPFSRALGFDGFVLMEGNVDVLEEEGSRRVIFEQPYKGLLPTYHRLDLSAERELVLSENARLTVHAGVINTYDRSNLFYLDVFTLRRVDQLPFIPTIGLKLDLEE
jgi:hypothetical protein